MSRLIFRSFCLFLLVCVAFSARPCFAQIYDISNEAHFPDFTIPILENQTEDNPPAGNVWTYGFRDTGAGGVNQILWNDNTFDEFTPFDRFQQQGADVIGGGGSFGDINTMCQENFAACDAGGNLGAQVKITDFGDGPTAHVVAGVDSYLKGTVHLFTDDDAPTDRAAIVRFTPPAAGDYNINVLFENRAASGHPTGDKPTYHAVVVRPGAFFETFDVISEGVLTPKVFNAAGGLGSGTFVEVNQTVTLGANDFIELAGMGSGAFPGVPIALVGTISVAAGVSGDFNRNGVVDAADYTVFRDNFGANESVLNGNGDGSGTVDPGDYTLWTNTFGNTSSVSGAAAVPEPGSAACLAVCLTLFGLWTSRKRCTA